MAQPLDMLFTEENCIALQGAIFIPSNKTTEDQKKKWEEKAVPIWPTSIQKAETLGKKLKTLQSNSAILNGEAEVVYLKAVEILNKSGVFEYNRVTAPPPPPPPSGGTGTALVGAGYTVMGGKIVAQVDVSKFQQEVNKLVAEVDKKWVSAAVFKQGAEANFFSIVNQLLLVDQSIDLVAILAARLLLGKDDRQAVDTKLGGITVLLNRAGKLSQGVVRLGGYIGLACASDDPTVKQLCRFVKNPLLGQDVDDREITQRSGESDQDFKNRSEKHKKNFDAYKKIMKEMQVFKKDYEDMDANIKLKIKQRFIMFISG